MLFLFCEEHYCHDVAASCFLEEAGAVAAELARVVLSDGVGAVISDNVVNIIT